MKLRKSGILLHVTSLPSDFGIGDLGRGAYDFADFLASSCQTLWQVLPFNPTSQVCGNSPYCSFSAFAGNPLLISPDLLLQDGYISSNELRGAPSQDSARVDFAGAARFKNRVLEAAFETFRKMGDAEFGYVGFADDNAHWLDDYALFMSLKERFNGAPWDQWPPQIRDRSPAALDECRHGLSEQIRRQKFYQFLFYRQWAALKKYCNQKQIQVIGDIPIYVSYDSSDVWTNPHYFKLDDDKNLLFVAGVPPDYFSRTGQLWGNPVYNWDNLRQASYEWWVRRMEHNLTVFDIVRLDHFRGFVAYWQVPAANETAVEGAWVKAPAAEFFQTLLTRFTSLPIIAEDLGVITSEVKEIMSRFEFPGMKILLFAFGDNLSTNPYVPHNHVRNCVVYTGTHDNNTARGWFENDATEQEKENLSAYFGRRIHAGSVSWQLVRAAMMSVASSAVIPMQDFLGLGAEARMNRPSIAQGNWAWRLRTGQLTAELAKKIAGLTKVYGRI